MYKAKYSGRKAPSLKMLLVVFRIFYFYFYYFLGGSTSDLMLIGSRPDDKTCYFINFAIRQTV